MMVRPFWRLLDARAGGIVCGCVRGPGWVPVLRSWPVQKFLCRCRDRQAAIPAECKKSKTSRRHQAIREVFLVPAT